MFSLLISSSLFGSSYDISFDKQLLNLNEKIDSIIESHQNHNEYFNGCLSIYHQHKLEVNQSFMDRIINISLKSHEYSRIQTPNLVPALIFGRLSENGLIISLSCLPLLKRALPRELAVKSIKVLLDSKIPAAPAG